MKSFKESQPIAVVVTDTPSHKVFIKQALASSHFLMEAEASSEVLEKIKNNEVSIIIASDKLEKDSIQDLCGAVRASSYGKYIPILIITNNLKKSFEQEMLAKGASDFLREPLNETDLQRVMTLSLHTKRTQEKLGPILKSIALPQTSQKPLNSMKFSQRDLAISEIEKALKLKQSLSLLLVDIDHHSKIKEKWGELALEELLDQVELFIKEHLRTQDILTHATEEKFIIILPKTSETAAEIIAEDLKACFKDHKFSLSKGLIKITISIGLTSLSKDENGQNGAYNQLENMLRRSEDYLSKAKKLGNRLVSGDHSS